MKNKKNAVLILLFCSMMSFVLTACQKEQVELNTETEIDSEAIVHTQEIETEETETEIIKFTSIDELNPAEVVPLEHLDLSDLDGFFVSYEIVEGDTVFERINGKSYQPNDDIALSELRYLKVLHYNYDGEIQVGEIIVNQKIEKDCLEIFQKLFEEEYQICRMVLIDDYWTGDGEETDGVSIKNNNTSCFNYRNVPGSTKRSKHALGLAIDINPYENPYVPTRNGKSDYSNLDETEYYYATNRNSEDAHVITHEDLAFKLFAEHGFTWGGDWYSLKDYQHFQKSN